MWKGPRQKISFKDRAAKDTTWNLGIEFGVTWPGIAWSLSHQSELFSAFVHTVRRRRRRRRRLWRISPILAKDVNTLPVCKWSGIAGCESDRTPSRWLSVLVSLLFIAWTNQNCEPQILVVDCRMDVSCLASWVPLCDCDARNIVCILTPLFRESPVHVPQSTCSHICCDIDLWPSVWCFCLSLTSHQLVLICSGDVVSLKRLWREKSTQGGSLWGAKIKTRLLKLCSTDRNFQDWNENPGFAEQRKIANSSTLTIILWPNCTQKLCVFLKPHWTWVACCHEWSYRCRRATPPSPAASHEHGSAASTLTSGLVLTDHPTRNE